MLTYYENRHQAIYEQLGVIKGAQRGLYIRRIKIGAVTFSYIRLKGAVSSLV